MVKEEFILNKPKNVRDITKVFMEWLGGDCTFVANYIDDDRKGLIPIIGVYKIEDEPLKPLYHLIPNAVGNYEIIKADKIELRLGYEVDKESKDAILSELNKLH